MSQERIIIGVDAYNGDSIPINNKEVSVTERVAEAVSMVREKNPNIELLVNYDESSLKDLAIAIKKEEIGLQKDKDIAPKEIKKEKLEKEKK